jgi:hypothetical protein
LNAFDDLEDIVRETAALISETGSLSLDHASIQLAGSILHNTSVYCDKRNQLGPVFDSINRTMRNGISRALSVTAKEAPPYQQQAAKHVITPREEADADATDSPFSTLRTWYLDHLDDPFPSSTHLNTLESTLPINRTAILQCLTNLRRRSGYTQALRTTFDGNKYAMGECVKRVWNGTETDETMKETIHKIMRYIDRSDKKEVGEWLQKVSDPGCSVMKRCADVFCLQSAHSGCYRRGGRSSHQPSGDEATSSRSHSRTFLSVPLVCVLFASDHARRYHTHLIPVDHLRAAGSAIPDAVPTAVSGGL